jgi:hypothetical protein
MQYKQDVFLVEIKKKKKKKTFGIISFQIHCALKKTHLIQIIFSLKPN